jgi:hypothetical protein
MGFFKRIIPWNISRRRSISVYHNMV